MSYKLMKTTLHVLEHNSLGETSNKTKPKRNRKAVSKEIKDSVNKVCDKKFSY